MRKGLFEGCGVALVTPFRNGKLDTDAYERILDRVIEAGVDALVPGGTTGEPACLSEDEWKTVISLAVKKADGKIPVIAGTGSNNTMQVIQRAEIAKDLGADAQLCVTPFYNKTTQQGLIMHYLTIADQSELPVYVYNVPTRTAMDIEISTYREILQHENIIAVKDACGNMTKSLGAFSACSDDAAFYSGEDQLAAPLRTLGYKGLISVTANLIPEVIVKLCHAELYEAGSIQRDLFMLNYLMFCETSPAPIKAALSLLGICENELRLPLVPIRDENMQLLKKEMKRLSIL